MLSRRTLLAAAASPLVARAQNLRPAYRSFWADAFRPGFKSPSEVDAMIADLKAARCNAIFPEFRVDGYTYYPNALEPQHQDPQYSKGFDSLDYTIRKAHEAGIEVHAWFAVYPFWRYTRPPEDPRHAWHLHGPHAEGRDMWVTVSDAGRLSTSMDPGHPDAHRYLADLMADCAANYPVDGIHLDYIRYPDGASFGYNPTARERFERLYGTGAPAARFSDFRRKNVTDLVRQVYLRANAANPNIKISAAVITWGNGPLTDAGYRSLDAYSAVFQDWRGWLEEGIIDLAMPMSYFREPTNAAFLDRWMAYYKDRQYQRGLLVGLGNYLNSISDSMSQIDRAMAPSATGRSALGFALYSYASTNILVNNVPREPNAQFYRMLGEKFADAPMTVPDLPWKSAPTTGSLMGWLHTDGDGMLVDSVDAVVESDTGADFAPRRIQTDCIGFFGAVQLPPDRYRVRILNRDGEEVFRTVARDVVAGRVTEFEARFPGAA